jgi:hypothetical protein
VGLGCRNIGWTVVVMCTHWLRNELKRQTWWQSFRSGALLGGTRQIVQTLARPFALASRSPNKLTVCVFVSVPVYMPGHLLLVKPLARWLVPLMKLCSTPCSLGCTAV